MEEFICKFCGKECKNANSHRNHERMCKMNTNRDVSYIHTGKWVESVKGHKASNQFIKAKELGKKSPTIWNKGEKCPQLSRKRTDEEKKKISDSMKKFYKGRSIWRTQIEKRKSYAEQYFDECFPELKQNYHALRYFLDLADPLKKLYMEIDGDQHYNDPKVVKHDKERTKLLEEDGWLLVDRIRWSDFQKLSKEEREKKINDLKIKFSSMDRNDIIEANKKELEIKKEEERKKILKEERLFKEGKIDKNGHINNNKLSFDEIEKRKNLILNCDVNLQKFGWVSKVVKATGLTKKQIYLIIDKENIACFKEAKRNQ